MVANLDPQGAGRRHQAAADSGGPFSTGVLRAPGLMDAGAGTAGAERTVLMLRSLQ